MSVPEYELERTRAWIAKAVAAVTLTVDMAYVIRCWLSGDMEALRALVTVNLALLGSVVTYYFVKRRR